MNPQSSSLSERLTKQLKKDLTKIDDVTVVIAPPTIHLEHVFRIQHSSCKFSLGAQNVHHEKLGAFTGETSLPMLQEFGVSHVILGHSERRAMGETDVVVNTKLHAVIKAGVTGVVCVGETKRDHTGHYLSFVEAQIHKALIKIPRAKLDKIVIAYEPIWAIGTKLSATSDDVHEMKLFIEKILSDLYGRNFAQKVQILYGGSVNAKNAHDLFTKGMIDGFLVGGASLHADEFTQIIKIVRTV
jgi:triosephosphate isomerase